MPNIILPKGYRKLKHNELIKHEDFDLTPQGWQPTTYGGCVIDGKDITITKERGEKKE